ncbi:helix-turn-helix transcriptional regulator [Nocardiopsis suaedae]|uniref:LuxR C-terminal-related transcriptional regulator n=1 Tax=Nocardiopsis suaedae TaxID=3018444 RepID=A0ABT4TFF4_9ACTN|nr:LuxR family transcriptional regulator [Nocardiopsis suaedae]MDA2803402.1 LuxR C-terminal-related transcriptional regulator [Nocardiopsis suaedae]
MFTPSPHLPVLRGRTHETGAVAAVLAAAREGRGAALLVTGAPGIGRTALLDHAERSDTDLLVVRADGVRAEADMPGAGLQRLVRPLADRVSALRDLHARALEEVLDGGEGRAPATAAALMALFTAAARERPVLCAVDDAHLLDTPSRQTLAAVARRAGGEHLAVLMSAPSAADPLLTGVPELPLRPLDRREAEAAAADAAPGAASHVRAVLARACHGNPLALRGFLRRLERAHLTGGRALPDPLPLDERLLEAHRAVLEALPERTRDILLLAAAEPGARIDTLVAAADGTEASVADLAPAEEAGAVRADGDRLRFSDPVLPAAVYLLAPVARRRGAHARLEQVFSAEHAPSRHARHRHLAAPEPDTARAEAMARLAVRARTLEGDGAAAEVLERAALLTPDPHDRAFRFASAADAAWRSGRPDRTADLLASAGPPGATGSAGARVDMVRGHRMLLNGDAFDAADTLVSAADRLAPHDRALTVEALMHAADAASFAGDTFRHHDVAQRGQGLVHEDDPDEMHFGTAFLQGCTMSFQGRYPEAAEQLRTAVRLARRIDEPRLLKRASVCALRLGDARLVRDLASRSAETARRRGAVALIPQALQFLVYAEFWTARLPSAVGNGMKGLRLSRETGQPNCATHLLAGLSLLAAIQGDESTCRARAESVMESSRRNGLGLPVALAEWALALLEMSQGDAVAAFTRLKTLAHAEPGRGHPTMRVLTAPLFVEAAVRNGAEDQAEVALAGYERWAEGSDSTSGRALVARGRALLARAGDSQDYAAHFEEALKFHRSCADDEVERARTAFLFGTALRRERDPGRAYVHLRDALESFERMGAGVWAERARAELRANGAPDARTGAPSPLDLTEQQRSIALLVAEGATNREIAAHLFLSPRTVEYHLRAVFRRLNIRSRVDLARLMR